MLTEREMLKRIILEQISLEVSINYLTNLGQSLILNWGEDTQVWEVAWISGQGDRYCGFNGSLRLALEAMASFRMDTLSHLANKPLNAEFPTTGNRVSSTVRRLCSPVKGKQMKYSKYFAYRWLMYWAYLVEGLIGVVTLGQFDLGKAMDKAIDLYINTDSPYNPTPPA